MPHSRLTEALVNPPPPHRAADPCGGLFALARKLKKNECGNNFKTYGGTRVHFRRKHPEKFHHEIQESREAEITKARWDPEEVFLMASHECRLTKTGATYMNQALAKLVPGRNVQAIKGRRRRASYKSLVADLLPGATGATSSQPPPAGSTGPLGPGREVGGGDDGPSASQPAPSGAGGEIGGPESTDVETRFEPPPAGSPGPSGPGREAGGAKRRETRYRGGPSASQPVPSGSGGEVGGPEAEHLRTRSPAPPPTSGGDIPRQRPTRNHGGRRTSRRSPGATNSRGQGGRCTWQRPPLASPNAASPSGEAALGNTGAYPSGQPPRHMPDHGHCLRQTNQPGYRHLDRRATSGVPR